MIALSHFGLENAFYLPPSDLIVGATRNLTDYAPLSRDWRDFMRDDDDEDDEGEGDEEEKDGGSGGGGSGPGSQAQGAGGGRGVVLVSMGSFCRVTEELVDHLLKNVFLPLIFPGAAAAAPNDDHEQKEGQCRAEAEAESSGISGLRRHKSPRSSSGVRIVWSLDQSSQDRARATIEKYRAVIAERLRPSVLRSLQQRQRRLRRLRKNSASASASGILEEGGAEVNAAVDAAVRRVLRIERYVPQLALLAHPNMRLFVTHAGTSALLCQARPG